MSFDEWVLALFDAFTADSAFTGVTLVLLLVALFGGGALVYALVTARVTTDEGVMTKTERPSLYWRSVATFFALFALMLALAALSHFDPERAARVVRILAPILFLFALIQTLRSGNVLGYSRAEQPLGYWGHTLIWAISLGVTAPDAIQEIRSVL